MAGELEHLSNALDQRRRYLDALRRTTDESSLRATAAAVEAGRDAFEDAAAAIGQLEHARLRARHASSADATPPEIAAPGSGA